MSSLPHMINALATTQRAVTAIQGSSPVTYILPVMAATPHDYDQIYMDHDRLPPMQVFNIDGEDRNGHQIGPDWVYTCMAQPEGGTLNLMGAPGMFSFGARVWATTQGFPDEEILYRLVVNEPNGPTRTIDMKGNATINLFLDKGASLFLLYRYNGSAQDDYYEQPNILPISQYMVTRISTAANTYEPQVYFD